MRSFFLLFSVAGRKGGQMSCGQDVDVCNWEYVVAQVTLYNMVFLSVCVFLEVYVKSVKC